MSGEKESITEPCLPVIRQVHLPNDLVSQPGFPGV